MKIFLVLLVLAFSSPAAFGEMYTWKDAKGTVFYTNSLHEIPARYLKRARVLDVATGKKGGPVTAQPGVATGPAATAPAPVPQQAPLARVQQPAPPAAAPYPTPAPATPAPVPAMASPAPAPPPPAAAVAAPVPQQRSTTVQQRRALRSRMNHANEE